MAFVVGGRVVDRLPTSVERYDAAQDVWREVSPLATGRDEVGLCAAGGELVVTGGWDGTVRRWDVSNAEWMQSGYAVHH